MLIQSFATALLGTFFIAGLAFGQANSPPASGQQAGNWVNQMEPGQWRASKLHSINVYNNNHEKIGEIDDILMDPSGNADVVVIEVGGFLGIGKHVVALPYNQVKFVDSPRDTSVRAGDAVPGTGVSMAERAAAHRQAARDRGYPDHALLNMTKDQLKAAPEFKWSVPR